jgi:hypothetical protein
MKTEKLLISKRQMDRLRIMYAFDVATKYNYLNPKVVFEDGLNPKWISLHDVVGCRNTIELFEWQLKELREKGWTTFGAFKIRQTKKGYVISTDLVRIRRKASK